MTPIVTSLIAFVLLFAASLFGMSLHRWMSEHHRSKETKDSVRIGMGSVATVAALVLGLLVASTQEAYEDEKNEVIRMSSKIVYLDQLFINFGSEASGCRTILRDAVNGAIIRIWPNHEFSHDAPDPGPAWSQTLPAAIQNLNPQTDAQRTFKSQATHIANELGQMRWLLFEDTETSISMPLIGIMVFWLALTFVSIGLFAPSNRIVILAQLLASFSIAGAIFLLLELDQPFAGIVKISSKPMMNALDHLVK